MTRAHPPGWAQSLLALFLPARGRDGVLGDLLEEYHEAQAPARGAAAADRWYVRQVLGFVWRACLPWGVLVSAVMIARDVYDLAAPTEDFHTRAAVTTYVCISLFAGGGFMAAWRSRRALSGTALGATTALMTCAVASVYALTAGQMLLNSAFASDPRAYAPLVEAADIPIVPIVILGILAGSIGGAIGSTVGRGARRIDLA
ncbi:MAG TPA: permease prefix domain 2-containing transporter [Vicinamibacterales bacterium]|jgi:hypothetical protein|nr:permease prefix domain 2-containing transporter [Vicinamibacterales bacterium]